MPAVAIWSPSKTIGAHPAAFNKWGSALLNKLASAGLLLGVISCLCHATDEPQPTAYAPTVELVDARLHAFDSVAGDNSEARSTYEKVRRWLRRAASYERDAKAYNETFDSAPKREAKIQERMDAIEADEASTVNVITLPSTEFEALWTKMRNQLREANSARNALDRHLRARESNADQVRKRLKQIAVRQSELSDSAVSFEPVASPSMLEAEQWLSAAESQALDAERRALEARLASQPARYSVIQVERAELTQRVDNLTYRVRIWEDEQARRQQSAVMATEIGIDPDSVLYELAVRHVTTKRELHSRRTELATELRETVQQRNTIQRQIRELNEHYATARRVVDYASDSEVLGNFLLVHWRELKSHRSRAPIESVARIIGNMVISRIQHEKSLAELASASGYVTRAVETEALDHASMSPDDRGRLIELVRKNRKQLNLIVAEESGLIEALTQLETKIQQLTDVTDEYESFLGGLILWVPSHPPVFQTEFSELPAEVRNIGQAMQIGRITAPSRAAIVGLLAVVALLFMNGRLRDRETALGRRIKRPREDSILFTLRALGLSALRSAPLPLLLICLSTLLARSGPGGNDLAVACRLLAGPAFTFCFCRLLAAKGGVGQVHLRWDKQICERLTIETSYLIYIGLPLAGVTIVVLSIEIGTPEAALGRLLYLFTLATLTCRVSWLLRRDPLEDKKNAVLLIRYRLRVLIVVMSSLLIVGITLGYIYSVNLVVKGSVQTLSLGFALVLLSSILMRWLWVARRRLRFEELLTYRDVTNSGELSTLEEEHASLGHLSDATLKLLRAATFGGGIVALIYLWAPLLPVLDALDQVTLWSTTTTVDGEPMHLPITLQKLVVVLFLVVATIYGGKKLPSLIELVLLSRSNMSAGARYAVSTLSSYAIVGSGLIAVLATLGLQWSQLQWLIAALGVGIGFGLQEIVANFICGLIILFERPIRVGDVVTVGEKDGKVTRIRIRATTIRGWDGKELLVPNKEFITSQLLNWTLSDPIARIMVNVGIAYGSNVEEALKLLKTIVVRQKDIVDNPPPRILFTELGDDALNLGIHCFIKEMDERWDIISQLHRDIYAGFEEAGIVFAYPQRDVHLDVAEPIRITVEEPSA
jgi:potassium efflux system protein